MHWCVLDAKAVYIIGFSILHEVNCMSTSLDCGLSNILHGHKKYVVLSSDGSWQGHARIGKLKVIESRRNLLFLVVCCSTSIATEIQFMVYVWFCELQGTISTLGWIVCSIYQHCYVLHNGCLTSFMCFSLRSSVECRCQHS